MNKFNKISVDCNLDRRAVLKFAAGVSASAVGPSNAVSAAVLANDGALRSRRSRLHSAGGTQR
jgi:hypothetical protein